MSYRNEDFDQPIGSIQSEIYLDGSDNDLENGKESWSVCKAGLVEKLIGRDSTKFLFHVDQRQISTSFDHKNIPTRI